MSVAVAILGCVVGVILWTVGKVRRREYGVAASTVAGVCAFPLLGVPLGYALDQWDIERERAARPWRAAMDSALAVSPGAEVPGTYYVVVCWDETRCTPGDTAYVTKAEITLLPERSASGESGQSNGCRWDLERDGPGGSLVRSYGPGRLRWTQRRDGTVEYIALDSPDHHGGSVYDVAVTREGLVGGLAGWSDGIPPFYYHLAGRRIGPLDAAVCERSEARW